MAIGGIGQGSITGDFTTLPADRAGEMLWSRTDLKPKDVDVAQIYDGFSILTLLWLEALQSARRRGGELRRGRRAHRARRRAAAEHQRRPALGRPLPRLRPHLRGLPAALGARRRAPGPDAQTCAVANGGFGYGALLLKTQ